MDGGRLMTQATDQDKFEIFPETETFFFVKDFDAQLTFQRDVHGEVNGVTLHQGGTDSFAPKLVKSD